MTAAADHSNTASAAAFAADAATASAAGDDPTPALGGATVLQVLPALGEGGGVERGTVEVARAIVAAGGRALVVSAGGPLVHDLARVGAAHHLLPVDSKNPVVMYRNIARLADLMRAEGVDIAHARSRAPAWSTLFAARRAGVRFVTTFHGTYGAGNFLKRRYNAVMGMGERVIAISRFIAGHAHRLYGVPAARLRVIHRGVDLERFDPRKVSAERVIALARAWQLPDGAPVVMLPGRLTRWKGQTVFIEAVARLGRRDIRALLVGSEQGRHEYRRELEKLILAHDLGGVVRIMDHCRDMAAAYMLSDVVVSASTDPEAFGRVVIEAQAMGRPVVATDHGGARETVVDDETGWRVPPGDVEALAAALAKALALGEDDRRRMAARAIDTVRANFSTRAMCERTLAVYREVLGPPAAA
ncbi:MAG: glycosyltransferase family 4 protein [Hyphomicrobiales bacterium]|nr:glycosyltransferase family 4 protein [Hyphomicrobiales bacterium]